MLGAVARGGWVYEVHAAGAGTDLYRVSLLEGYQEQRPLSAAESAALPALLPLVHAESALSEMGYFHGVMGSTADTALAYDRFVGHTRWFGGEDGTRLLNRIRTRLQRPGPVRFWNGSSPPTGEDRRAALVP
ncbi:hypothetical protein AQJ43_14330 [Streptomyces avermitilis]|uniref:Uncharacterized protein n=2 Tax=Streptomyces avermitilis TaxID=33903 RepID=Q82AW3_STRAW|nr:MULTISPECIES: hypothetical protein [Streptomyces]KUN54494.1 hypothetical protein AQJ43_14330 [Streptomyces avermitilis]MYT01499.1 hypothetical protein [Streptomyces sp. SID5469]OOV28027.1 hypothetical protein SM007_18690 [Streptomyces avermitilis]BAC73654.1 hypothetical protein SAVERM_5942 [Streptomyces avermitilis MA-4680 = NBRC 14893]BBJ54143.1 hypothetical protein SAVMC3_67720 [Streptomyces avermitilis]